MVQEEVFQAIGWHGSQQLVQHIWEQHVEKCVRVLKITNCDDALVMTQSKKKLNFLATNYIIQYPFHQGTNSQIQDQDKSKFGEIETFKTDSHSL